MPIHNLCLRCRDMNLFHDSFKINVDHSLLPNDLGDQLVPLAHQRIYVGTMTQIRDSATSCRLCALISSSVNDLPLEERQDDVKCYLYWEVDGRTTDSNGSQVNCTRRLRISWDADSCKRYEAHILLAAPETYDKSDVDYSNRVDHNSQFLGRHIGSNVSKKNIIREFLRICQQEHKCCAGHLSIKDPFAQISQDSYFGVIDIENESLVPLVHEKSDDGTFKFREYAAVSYVWGASSSQRHSTRKANITDRRKTGGLAEVINSLPPALKQSIDLVQSMGIRYIWIDSLCIVQDSGRNFELNAKAMHSIYGNSTITICAAEGKDATTGLLALKERPEQVFASVAEGTNLVLHRPCEVSIKSTEWNKRAWTFQERLLSRRCIIFTDKRIFFQCRSTTISEDIFPDKKGNGWSLELVGAPLRMLPELKTRALSFYMKCVSLYTERRLSEPFDRLAAFRGMCSLMEETMVAPFTFGLPISHFDFVMLWQPTGNSVRLTKPLRENDARYQNMKFPSWSWSGWQGDSAEYNREMLAGCLPNVQRWLMIHTWIDWHIRDGHGNLKRLWPNGCEEDKSEIEEWRGYCHPDSTVANAGLITAAKPIYTLDGANDVDADPELVAMKMNGVLLAPTDQALGTANALKGTPNGTRLWGNSNGAYSHQRRRDHRYVDCFGRSIRPEVRKFSHNSNFSLTLPEDPYRVCTVQNNMSQASIPTQPLLQFFTWRQKFSLVMKNPQPSSVDFRRYYNQKSSDFWRYLNPRIDDSGTIEHLTECHIQHRSGDKCGSIKVDTNWLRAQGRQTTFEFIAISDAKSFTTEEFPDWTYYIPLERHECDWELYFVLLVEHDEAEGIHRRVALGKVFRNAFKHTADEWKEIILG